jgi:hypothetical protein
MKLLKIFSLSLLLMSATAVIGLNDNSKNNTFYVETPAKTVIVKHPLADDANKFFSSSTIINFEIYKPGTKEDLARIVAALKNDPAVESVNEGTITGGDYYAMTIVLKTEKNKSWFVAAFKKAGLNTIKMNNKPVIEVEKL